RFFHVILLRDRQPRTVLENLTDGEVLEIEAVTLAVAILPHPHVGGKGEFTHTPLRNPAFRSGECPLRGAPTYQESLPSGRGQGNAPGRKSENTRGRRNSLGKPALPV